MEERNSKKFSFCIVDDCSNKYATEVLECIDKSNLDLTILRVKSYIVISLR